MRNSVVAKFKMRWRYKSAPSLYLKDMLIKCE